MALWMVRGGRDGVFEQMALEKGLIIIGFAEMPDMGKAADPAELRTMCKKAYPDSPVARISNFLGRLWSFRERMQPGDLVVMPLNDHSTVAIGRITGPYEYHPDLPDRATHARPVEWLRTDVPLTEIPADILRLLRSRGTLKSIRAADGQARILQIGEGRTPPPPEPSTLPEPSTDDDLDIEQVARGDIIAYIGRHFHGHELTRLVDELLRTQGYHTRRSPAGPDGGVDILAGGGPMGFDRPRLCVQVKAGNQRADVGVLRELQGVMKNHGADQGLLVSWGGWNANVDAEAKKLFFEVRLWKARHLVDELLQHYDQLPEGVKAELPLKQVYMLVPEEEGD